MVGQSDGGAPVGLPVTDKLLLELADLRTNDGILPFPQVSVRRLKFHGAELAVVIVEPHVIAALGVQRTGVDPGSTRPATLQEESVLSERRRVANLPFDARPLASATIDDLDLARLAVVLPQLVADDVLRENGRPVDQRMASLRFVSPPESRPTPTGVLVVGRDPEEHLPGSYVQFVRFDGVQLSAPVLSQHHVSGTAPEVLLEVEKLLRLHIATIVAFEGLATEERRPSVPFEVLQQLFRNAVLHRTYESSNAPVRVSWFDDRVEIHSPGGPYGQVTVETIGQPGLTDYRNPTLAGALSQLGFVQQFGVGIQIARDRLAQNGNLPLEFQASVAAVVAIVRLKK